MIKIQIGVVWSHAKEHLETPEAGRSNEGLLPRPFVGECGPPRLVASRALEEYISVVSSHYQVCGNLLQQPRETDTILLLLFLSSLILTYLIHKKTFSASPSPSPLSSSQTVAYHETT